MTQLFGDRRRPRRRRRRPPGRPDRRRHRTRELLERELRVAQRIQRTLVLLTGVEADGWEIASDYRPARSIGGDFFDVFPILDPARPRQLGVVIADVSGKGISAALLMAFVRPVMRSALDRSGDPVEALELTNRILVDERRTGPVRHGPRRRARPRHRHLHVRQRRPRDAAARRRRTARSPRWVQGGGPLLGMFGRLDLPSQRSRSARRPARPLHGRHHRRRAQPDGARFGDERFRDRAAGCVATAGGGHLPRRHRQSVLRSRATAMPADDLALLVFRRLSS